MFAPTILSLVFGSQLLVTVAEVLPSFDTDRGCRAAVTVMPGNFDACMKDEQDAHARLTTQWDGFAAADRETCTQNETSSGTPSYVELLTCLQMAKAAHALPADKTDGSNR